MNKKLAVLAVACTILILLSGYRSSVLFGTEYVNSKSGYNFSVSAAANWWDCNWSYFKEIIIDHTKVQESQTGFPVLIYRSSDSELATYAQSDGDDIAFVNQYNTTQYKHEIEKYDSNTGELTAWVNVTGVSSTTDTILYMYYGNPSCSNQQNVTGTWGENYNMAQHLNQSSGTLFDSTSNNNDGTNNGATYNSSSKIDGGYDFDGTDNITVGSSDSLNITNGITLEGWVRDPPIFLPLKKQTEERNFDKRAINITKAEHLDEKRDFLKDIYKYVRTKDNTWSEPINNGEYVRVTFEEPLENSNYITIFARSAGVSQIKVYPQNNDTLVTKINRVAGEEFYRVYLTDLINKCSTFDLQTVGDPVEYDYIVDPASLDAVDSNTSNVDGSADKGTETNFPNAQDTAPDADVMTIQEANNAVTNQVTYQAAGAGAATTGDPTPGYPAGLVANDLILLQVTVRDTSSTVTTPTGFNLLYGPDSTGTGRQWIYYRFSTGTESGTITVDQSGATCCIGRMYSFRNVSLSNFTESGGFGSGSDSSIEMQAVTTTGAKSLAVSFVFENDDNTLSDSAGESGGDWTEAILEYTTTQGSDGGVQLQNATMASAGTITGGTTTMGAVDPWGVRAFALKPTYINYSIDFEYNWSNADYTADQKQLCFYVTSHTGSENLNVSYWTGTSWTYLGQITGTGWTNLTASGLTSQNYYIRLIGDNESTDNSSQDSWNIDLIMLYPLVKPYQTGESPTNGATNIDICPTVPALYVICRTNNTGDTMNATWWSNSSGSWVQFAYNNSIANNTNITQTFANATSLGTTYWWSVNLTDGYTWTNNTYRLTTQNIETSVNTITPYNITTSPLTITATGNSCLSSLNNVTLWYRYSSDNSTWWDSSFPYRKKITITGQTGAGTNYQVLLKIGESSGAAGANFNLGGRSSDFPSTKDDGGDLRFANNANNVQLDFWVESVSGTTPNRLANVWVEVQDSLESNVNIYCYYGNSSASSASNGDNTFLFFDDFLDASINASKWAIERHYSPGSIVEYSDYIRCASGSTSGNYGFVSLGSSPIYTGFLNNTIRFRARAGTDGIGEVAARGVNASNTGYKARFDARASQGNGLLKLPYVVGSWIFYGGFTGGDGLVPTVDAWYIYDFNLSGTSHYMYRDGTLVRSVTDTDYQTAGEISLQNHYGAYADYDWVAVKKFVTTEPSFNSASSEESWMIWSNASNPDTTYPWSWNFDFPNGTGYYQFYSIGKKTGFANETAPNSADAICYYNRPPSQSGPSPTNTSTGICIPPRLYVTCTDPDGDITNATWWSNSSGSWVQFASNTSIANNTNITQTNTNFSTPGATYWWRVILTDGTGGTDNQTYNFTTNNIPTQSGPAPANGQTKICPTPRLYIICTDTDPGQTMTATWTSNSSGSWTTFATNNSITTGTNITQTNNNFTNPGTTYYWSINLTDGCNWTNTTYSFTTNNLPTQSGAAPTSGTTAICPTNNQQLYIIATDTDSDTMTATWRSNSTGTWQTFATNNTITTGTNITQTNNNFSSPGTTYYWSINLTDGCNWTNTTYNFTTNYAPTQTGPSPTNGATGTCIPTRLYVICNDQDSQTMTATWTSNSSGTWQTFATNSSISSGTNITQTNQNFTNQGTVYYWSISLTDGCNWTNTTYSFTTNNAPTQSGESPTNQSTNIPLTPKLYIICTDTDSDTMTATWKSNSSESWITFATNNSITTGTNITQTFTNATAYSTNYWWSINLTDGCNWTNTTYQFTTQASPATLPIVTTNTSTGVEETNATLNGYLQNNGSAATTCGFRYGTTSGGYTQNFSVGIIANTTEFSNNNGSLTPGQIYFYQAWAINSVGFAIGSEMVFLTKPNPPITGNLTVRTNSSTIIYLNWTQGTGANNTYIERNATAVTSWTREQGTVVYNSTGINYEDTGLTPGTTYYYQVWSYTNWTYDSTTLYQWSDNYESGSNTTKNVPVLSNENPTNSSTSISLNPTLSIQVNHSNAYQMNITWYWGTISACPNLIGTNSSVNNGTYTMNNDNNFSLNAQTYYWKVTVNDGHGEWTNETYHFTTIGNNKVVVSKGQNAYSLEIHPDSTTLYGYINGNSVSTPIDTNLHYVTLTYDGTDMKLYIDGELKNNQSLSASINTNANDLILGDYLTGTLDEIRISDTARSAAWINTTYLNTNSPTTFATFGEQVGILRTWAYRKQITINASMVDTDLTNFPVLINTIDSDLKSNALSNGYDILFTDSSVSWDTGSYAQKLNHEIEKYDSNTGELVAWVNVTSLSSATNTILYMYYGNTLCTANRQNPTGVWDSNYVMVLHFEETTDNYQDSTSNNNDGVPSAEVSRSGNSPKIGTNCPDFDGSGNDDYITVYDNPSINFTTEMTWEGWVNTDDVDPATNEGNLISKNTGGSGNGWDIEHYYTSSPAVVLAQNGEGGATLRYSNTAFSADIWTYRVCSFDDVNVYFYNNGTADGSGGFALENTVAKDMYIGCANPSTVMYEFDGTIDEFRLSNVNRSGSWIKTSYNTMNDSANFTAFGPQKIRNVAPTQSNPSPDDGTTGINLNPPLSVTVNDTNADSMTVTFRTNASGSWTNIGSNNSVYNGTYSQTPSNMNSLGTTYYWSVNVTDGTAWTNATYNFTTANQLNWWNTNWNYRKLGNITNNIIGYETEILVGNSSGGNVTCEGHAQSDFDDIRFISYSDNSTTVPYWRENYTTDDQATFWINNSYNDSSIWMYYGNAGASTTSDGDTTFDLFDDFNRADSATVGNGWTEDEDSGVGALSIESNTLKIVQYTNYFCHIEKAAPALSTFVLQGKTKSEANGGTSWMPAVAVYWSAYEWTHIGIRASGLFVVEWDKEGTVTYNADMGSGTVTNWYYYRIRIDSTNAYYDVSSDGQTWTNLKSTAKGTNWGTPTLIIVGKGYADDAGIYPNSDLDNSFTTAGDSGTTYADTVFVRKIATIEPSWSSFGTEQNKG